MASQIASLEEDKKAYEEQLEIVKSQLRDDPGNVELKSLLSELADMIQLLDESLSELKPKQASKPAAESQKPAPPQPQDRWQRDKPSGSQSTASPYAAATSSSAAGAPAEEEPAIAYQVNDEVSAKWLSGDRKFWPARITSITGSSSAPIYLVKFKNYKGTETLRAKDIRPVSNKRKADGPPATANASTAAAAQQAFSFSSAPAPAPDNGIVMSAAASRYPEPPKGNEAETNPQAGKPPRAKKIKANKELEAGKSKWQEFSSKSKASKSKKDSMFRTPQGIHGRVGFTGSGQAMRKDPTRSRHVYQTNEEAD
ncbi:unnamed protein product [Parascedosporium putredinis]|uniref:Tudor domain-containing protein n=1 Tax=Parascedosporium putredinis TaxID=1442378 RepID=A0A9P1H4I3_9PEZI|nr:unnamed protein product [Parascedosporium putredinis]CAI7996041.1 unnamed protein product [Parascedosporium putredinis]